MKLIKKVLQTWYGIAVLDSDFVDCSTIRASLLSHPFWEQARPEQHKD